MELRGKVRDLLGREEEDSVWNTRLYESLKRVHAHIFRLALGRNGINTHVSSASVAYTRPAGL